MRATTAIALLVLMLAGCQRKQLEPVELQSRPTIPSSTGKCTQIVGTRTVEVACP